VSAFTHPFLRARSAVCPFAAGSAHEIRLQNKNQPVTPQAAIIIAVIAFSSGSLATVAVYAQRPPISIICSVVLAIVVYLALRLSPL